NVPGYRRIGLNFESFERSFDQVTAKAVTPLGTRSVGSYTDFRPGLSIYTGNPLDVAIDGDGFFTVRGPEGPLYTRNGTFVGDQDGQLLTRSGHPVLGTNGPITLPPNALDVRFGVDGTVSADGAVVDQLRLVTFPDQSRLMRAGATSFTAPDDVQPQNSTSTI